MEPVTPDAVAGLGTFLRGHAAVSAIAGQRVSTRLSGTYPAVRLALVGGDPSELWGGADATVQVECWSTLDDEATGYQLARTVVAAVSDARGIPVTGGYLLDATASEPFASPDPDTNRARFIVTVTVSLLGS